VKVRATAGILAVAAMAMVPSTAIAAKKGSIYDITSATGFERVTFAGDANAFCQQYGVCGYNGTVTYSIGGKPHGTLQLTRARSGKVVGSARYRTSGITKTRVTPPNGGADCVDTVSHKTDVFMLNSFDSRFQNLVLDYHLVGDDYLDTKCTAPNEGAVADAGVLPQAVFSAADFFRGNRPRFTLAGSNAFRAAGFSSTIEYKLSFKIKARACSPRCSLR
jgi:hypothetical protein